MTDAPRTGIWIIAMGVIIALLFLGRAVLSPFALAVFLFLVMEGFAHAITGTWMNVSLKWARAVSIVGVVVGFALFIMMMANGVASFTRAPGEYEREIDALISNIYGLFNLPDAPQISQLVLGEPGQQLLGAVVSSVGNLSENFILILIYVAFLFLAQSTWTEKLNAIFGSDNEQRDRVRQIGEQARRGIETYLWTQTVISALITLATFATLKLLGVQNALFLAGIIFVLNYIPTVGSIVAAVVPPLFALVQPAETWPVWMSDNTYINATLTFVGVSFWQFFIGNFIQPRMMGDNLNLSALVVLLALAIWGALWGIPGMFLSAPLTVIIMILTAQSRDTYWIAVLLSANGRPGKDPRLQPEITDGAIDGAQQMTAKSKKD
jgi:predicted PurR-regulated permease PerM